jgi:hypothetical protein
MMEQILEVLRAFGLNPATAGTAVGLAIMLRYGRGMLRWLNSEWTYVAALLLGALGAMLEAVSGQPWQATTKTGLAMFCVVMVLQKVLEKAAAAGIP